MLAPLWGVSVRIATAGSRPLDAPFSPLLRVNAPTTLEPAGKMLKTGVGVSWLKVANLQCRARKNRCSGFIGSWTRQAMLAPARNGMAPARGLGATPAASAIFVGQPSTCSRPRVCC